mmetsp:Transcript_113155/g.316204  ORF Transcript_113155/g.316204 Transcript_113155/m.316204 type:complete len:278 (-) Transcript_113155:627-1460(-)
MSIAVHRRPGGTSHRVATGSTGITDMRRLAGGKSHAKGFKDGFRGNRPLHRQMIDKDRGRHYNVFAPLHGIGQHRVGVILFNVATVLHALFNEFFLDIGVLENILDTILVREKVNGLTQGVEVIQVLPEALVGVMFPQAHAAETLNDDVLSMNSAVTDRAVASIIGAHFVARASRFVRMLVAFKSSAIQNVVMRLKVQAVLEDHSEGGKVGEELFRGVVRGSVPEIDVDTVLKLGQMPRHFHQDGFVPANGFYNVRGVSLANHHGGDHDRRTGTIVP